MRSRVALLAMLAMAGEACGGWETIVLDIRQTRSITLIGSAAEPGNGISISCTGLHDGVPASVLVTMDPWLDYAIVPGEPTAIIAGSEALEGSITSNDSRATAARADVESLAGILAAIGRGEQFLVEVASRGEVDSFVVDSPNSGTAVAEFIAACGL